jgi:hypothetical protein
MNARGGVLVLNKNWVPIDILNVYEAISKVFAGRASFLDVETCITYDFEGWVLNWDDAIQTAKVASEKVIGSARYRFLIPEVIVCSEYRGFGYKMTNHRPKFSRTNIYRRDKNVCQYCGKKFKTEDLTMDHVFPKANGGQMTWENVVLACVPCNHKKANRTPQQAGMKLIRKPVRPTADDLRRSPIERLMNKVGNKPPKTWEAFLGKMTFDKAMNTMYWNVELDGK